MNGITENVIDPFAMGVSRHLIAVEIGDDEMGGGEMAEGETGVTLIRLKQNDISLYLSAEGTVIQQEGRYTLDLIRPLLIPSNGLAVFTENMGNHFDG